MTNIEKYGWNPQMLPEGESAEPARITAVHKERYAMVCAHGSGFARLKSSVYYNNCAQEYPTTGDFVLLHYNSAGDSQIIKTLPRRTFFSRRDPSPGRGEQAVAANFETVFIMQSLNHDLNEKRLERYVTLAWQSGAVPVVVLTKADLIEDYSDALCMLEQAAAGVAVHAVSAKTGAGLEDLAAYLHPGQTVVLLGSSGVGKSSLVNALAGQDAMQVQAIREDDSKGRHTTTHRQLILLPCGAMVIDTPGMRELGMVGHTDEGLGEAFADVEDVLGRCRFSDCRHETEPGCAVKAAIAAGELTEARWQSYRTLQKEARFAEDRAEFMRERQQWHKTISKWNKEAKKNAKLR